VEGGRKDSALYSAQHGGKNSPANSNSPGTNHEWSTPTAGGIKKFTIKTTQGKWQGEVDGRNRLVSVQPQNSQWHQNHEGFGGHQKTMPGPHYGEQWIGSWEREA